MTKRMIALLAVLSLVTLSLIGCAPKQPAQPAPSSGVSGSFTTAGSTSVQPLSELLAEGFMAKNEQVRITVQGGGSSQGIAAAQSGTAQIGASSRDLKTEEKADLKENVIARDGIALIVNKANKVEDLTVAQIRGIYAGDIKNWKDVGGADAAIVVVTRDEASGTRGAFEEIIIGKDKKIIKEAIVQTSGGAVSAAVEGNPNAIGYISFSGLSDRTKSLKVEGAAPTADNVKSGSYKVNRPFIYLTKGEPSGAIKAFIEFALSAEGQKMAESLHLLTVK